MRQCQKNIPDSRGASSAMTGEQKFANVFKASSAGGDIQVIKFLNDARGDQYPTGRASVTKGWY